MDIILAVLILIILVDFSLLGALTIIHRMHLKYGNTAPKGFKILVPYLKARIAALQGNRIDSGAPPSLLKIPAELRNEIYRLVLISDEQIEIKDIYKEPALLSTCRQIRKEATPILYLGNSWVIDLPDWNFAFYDAFYISVHRKVLESWKMKVAWTNNGSLNDKAGLLRFIKFLHENQHYPGIRYEPSKYSLESAVTGACEIARSMRKQPWEEISSVLEIYLDEVVKGKNGWEWL